MTSPSWPFSWPAPPGWGTDIDERVAARPWQVKAYRVRTTYAYAEVTRLGDEWFGTTVVNHSAHTIPDAFPSAAAAMVAVDQVLTELAAET